MVAAVLAVAAVGLTAQAAGSASAPASSTTAVVTTAASTYPVIYANAEFGGAITRTEADNGPVSLHFRALSGTQLTLTVTSSPWATWADNNLDAPDGTVSDGVGAVTGFGTVLNNNAFATRPDGTRYAVCFTYLRGSTPTSLHYTASTGWEVISPADPPCPATEAESSTIALTAQYARALPNRSLATRVYPRGPVINIKPPLGAAYGVIEPTGLGPSASGDFQARHLKWQSWNYSKAYARGTEVVDECPAGCGRTETVTITLTHVVQGHYTDMVWTIGTTTVDRFVNKYLTLQLSQGGKIVPPVGLSPPAPLHDYYRLSQLVYGVTVYAVKDKGLSLPFAPVCHITGRSFRCVLYTRVTFHEYVATGVIAPSGRSFTVRTFKYV